MPDDLIFDVGMHQGEDTEFYLKKGFRVVAVDADPELCGKARERFRLELASGRLSIVNKAISSVAGKVILYKNLALPIWNTLNSEWAERNRTLGADSVAVEVDAVTLDSLLPEFGVPHYLKIDIEGMDLAAVESLAVGTERPQYLSLESNKVSFQALGREFDVLADLGYRSFKVVPQHRVESQKPPRPAREGAYVAHRFSAGSSGLFGEEAPGKWMTRERALDTYRPIFLRYALTGDDAFVQPRYQRFLRRVGLGAGWYDTHARLAR